MGFSCWAHGQAGIPFYSPPPWRETRLASLRWEHMYVERKWLCVESYSVLFYLLQSRLVLVSAGESVRGRARVHGAYFDVVDFFDHSRGRMPT